MSAFSLRRVAIHLATGAALALGAPQASAATIDWVVAPFLNDLSFEITLTGFLGTETVGASNQLAGAPVGTVGVNPTTSPGPLGPPTLAFTGGGLTLDPMSFSFSTYATVGASFSGLGGGLVGGPVAAFYYAGPAPWYIGGPALFDLTGFALALDQGTLQVTGPAPSTVSLAAAPILFDLSAYVAEYHVNNRLDDFGGATEVYDLELFIPDIDVTTTLPYGSDFGITTTMRLSGSVFLVGVLPEPGAAGLLAAGLAGLALRRRHVSA